jgi:hypothetical protein
MINILIPIDFSAKTKTAIASAFLLFGSENVKYTLVNTYYEPQAASGMLINIKDILHQDSLEDLKKEMEWIKKNFPYQVQNCTTISHYGDFRISIDMLVKELDIQLVLMSTEPKVDWHHKFLNNHRGLISNHTYPVMIVPSNYDLPEKINMSYTSDLSAISEAQQSQLEWLNDVFKPVCNNFSITTVIKQGSVLNEREVNVRNELLNVLAPFNPVFNALLDDTISTALNQFIDTENVDVLIMTARRHNFLDKLLNNSNTKEMALLSNIPLLVLPEKS